MAQKFDPITLEVLWRRLISIVDEADAAVARTSFSSLIRDAHDYGNAFFDGKGRQLCQGTMVTPGQAGGMLLGIKRLVNSVPEDYWKPGDVVVCNDPWYFAGHLNDVCVMSPIFYKDRLVAFTSCILHHSDIGGRIAADNREVYEEGLFIPPIKIYDGGVLVQQVVNLIRWNVRTPEDVMGDLRSQIAANHVCSQKVVEMMDDVGLDTLEDLSNEILDRTERSMRDAIHKIPDGVYFAEEFIEQPGEKRDLKIKATVHVKGSDLFVDFGGSSPQADWSVNCVYNVTYAYLIFAAKSMLDPEIPNNDGCARPITMKALERSIVNCSFPASVGTRIIGTALIQEVIYRALAPVIPTQVLAGSGASPSWMILFHGTRHNQEKFFWVGIGGAGMGASYKMDGHYPAHFPANASNTPAEILEGDIPIIVEARRVVPDSGGAGKRRGGLGYEMVFRIPDDEYAPIPPIATILYHGGRV